MQGGQVCAEVSQAGFKLFKGKLLEYLSWIDTNVVVTENAVGKNCVIWTVCTDVGILSIKKGHLTFRDYFSALVCSRCNPRWFTPNTIVLLPPPLLFGQYIVARVIASLPVEEPKDSNLIFLPVEELKVINLYLLTLLLLPGPRRCSRTASYSSGYLFILEKWLSWIWL